MDGVLVDSEPLHKRAKELAFGEFGLHFPPSTYDSYKGRPDTTMFREVLADKSVEEIAELLHRKHQIFEKNEHELQPIPGAVDFLLWATGHYRLALATSATPRNREAALKVLGIGDRFEAMVDTSRFQRSKPDPEIFLITMQDLDLGPADCWIIEDSIAGIRAAKAAQCFAVALTTTFGEGALREAGADAVVASFAELRESLESLLRGASGS